MVPPTTTINIQRSRYGDLYFKETAKHHKCIILPDDHFHNGHRVPRGSLKNVEDGHIIPRPQPIDFVLHYFNDARELFYIDIGANDGITWSNSYALEKYLNWDGICVDPHPEKFIELSGHRANKTISSLGRDSILPEKEYPYKCECINACLSNQSEKVIFRSVHGYANMLSGILDFFDPDQVDRIDLDIKNHGGFYEDIEIECRKLQDICVERSIKTIDYMSIDCEGAEHEILKGLDLAIFQPSLISIETSNDLRDSDSKAINYLLTNNYKLEAKICGDSFFSKKH